MSAIKSNNLVVPVAPLNITKDNGYTAETGAYGHFDFASRGFNTLTGSATLTPKDPNFLFKNGELRQTAKNDFTIQSNVNDTYDLTYALVFKVYSTATFAEHYILFGNNIYNVQNAGAGTALGVKNSNGTNILTLQCRGYDPKIDLCNLDVGTAYFALVQREASTKKYAIKVIRMTDNVVMYNMAPTFYNGNPLADGYFYGIGRNQWNVNFNTIYDFGMSELIIWKSLQYANVDAIYQRAKARAKIKGYV